jgi:FkbM family methyltransferase
MAKIGRSEQMGALFLALDLVTDWTVAVDGGANTGDWTAAMAGAFNRVHAFEPAPDMAIHLRRRFETFSNVEIHEQALWDTAASVSVTADAKRQDQPRSRFVVPNGSVPAIPLDSLKLENCGLLKLDLEGAEPLAIKGAEQTIRTCRPVMIVECKKFRGRYDTPKDAGEMLKGFGMKAVAKHGPDVIFAWPRGMQA